MAGKQFDPALRHRLQRDSEGSHRDHDVEPANDVFAGSLIRRHNRTAVLPALPRARLLGDAPRYQFEEAAPDRCRF